MVETLVFDRLCTPVISYENVLVQAMAWNGDCVACVLGRSERGDRAFITGVDEVCCDVLRRSGDGTSQLQVQTEG